MFSVLVGAVLSGSSEASFAGSITARSEMSGAFFTNETYARGDQAYVAAVEAQVAADAATEAANSTLTTFSQDDPPVAISNGDLWFDTNDGYKLYRWKGDYGNVARTNYAPNPSPVYNSTGWSAVRGTLSTDTTVTSSGRSMWKVMINDLSTVGDLSQCLQWTARSVTVAAGDTWTMTAYARSSSLSAITKYRSRILWRNGSGSLIATSDGVVITATDPNTITKVPVTATVPAGATAFDFLVGPFDGSELNISDAFWIGDVVFEKASDTGVYFDGGMTNAGWSGTAGNSSSTFTPAWVVSADQRVSQALTQVTTEYSVNSSETVAPTTGWSTATPTRTPGTFVWYRNTTTRGDGTTATTNPVLLTGNTGATGATGAAGPAGSTGPTGPAGTNGSNGTNGVSITSVTPYFMTQFTGTAAPAKPAVNPPLSPWLNAEPGYAPNTELWRTERIVFSDTTFAYTTPSKVAAYAQINAWSATGTTNIDGGKIATDSITTLQLAAAAVTAENLAALIVLVSKIASAADGRRWEADQAGIRLYDTNNQPIIVLPTDTASAATFNGDVVASSLTISDQFALRGLVNEISKNSNLTISSKTTAPSTAPVASAGLYTSAITPPANSYSISPLYGWVRDGGYFYSQYLHNDTFIHVTRYDATTLAQDTTFDIVTTMKGTGMGGLTVLSGVVYSMGQDDPYAATQWQVEGYTISTKAKTYGKYNVLPASSTLWNAVLGNDGTNLLVAYLDNTSTPNYNKIRRHTPSTGALLGTDVTNITYADDLVYIGGGNFDYGSQRYILAWSNRTSSSNPLTAVTANSGGTWVNNTNECWSSLTLQRGMCWDTTTSTFVGLNNTPRVTWWSNIMWTLTTAGIDQFWVSTTWYDSAATGGSHESDQGPRKSFTMKKRNSIMVTAPPIPAPSIPASSDDVNSVGIYIGRGTTDPGRTKMERQLYTATGVTGAMLQSATIPALGATSVNPPPATNNFPDQTPGRITTADSTKFTLNGDGSGNWFGLTATNSGLTIGKTVTTEAPFFQVTSLAANPTTLTTTTTFQDLKWGAPTNNDDTWTTTDNITWVCPRPGIYTIWYQIIFAGITSGNWIRSQIVVNTIYGTQYIHGQTLFGEGSPTYDIVHPMASMAAGGTIKIQNAVSATATTITGSAGSTILRMMRIG